MYPDRTQYRQGRCRRQKSLLEPVQLPEPVDPPGKHGLCECDHLIISNLIAEKSAKLDLKGRPPPSPVPAGIRT
jgi:hypothetical protein